MKALLQPANKDKKKQTLLMKKRVTRVDDGESRVKMNRCRTWEYRLCSQILPDLLRQSSQVLLATGLGAGVDIKCDFAKSVTRTKIHVCNSQSLKVFDCAAGAEHEDMPQETEAMVEQNAQEQNK